MVASNDQSVVTRMNVSTNNNPHDSDDQTIIDLTTAFDYDILSVVRSKTCQVSNRNLTQKMINSHVVVTTGIVVEVSVAVATITVDNICVGIALATGYVHSIVMVLPLKNNERIHK